MTLSRRLRPPPLRGRASKTRAFPGRAGNEGESVEEPPDAATPPARPWDHSGGSADGQPQPERRLPAQWHRTRATRPEQALAGSQGRARTAVTMDRTVLWRRSRGSSNHEMFRRIPRVSGMHGHLGHREVGIAPVKTFRYCGFSRGRHRSGLTTPSSATAEGGAACAERWLGASAARRQEHRL